MGQRKFIIAVLAVLIGFAASIAQAETHPLLSGDEIEIHNKAKHRLYPGGQDEESLKVQTQLPANLTRSTAIKESRDDVDASADE